MVNNGVVLEYLHGGVVETQGVILTYQGFKSFTKSLYLHQFN